VKDNVGLQYVVFKWEGESDRIIYLSEFDAEGNLIVAVTEFEGTEVYDFDGISAVWGGFHFNLTARDVNGNEGYKTTHVKGVLEAAVKAVLGALWALAKAIYGLVHKVLHPVLCNLNQPSVTV
jgi:hypothetical protein